MPGIWHEAKIKTLKYLRKLLNKVMLLNYLFTCNSSDISMCGFLLTPMGVQSWKKCENVQKTDFLKNRPAAALIVGRMALFLYN